MQVRAAPLAPESLLQGLRRPGDFLDGFAVRLPEALAEAPLGRLAQAALASPPGWARGLTALRDAAVRPFGLHGTQALAARLPAFDPDRPRPGAGVGFFPILAVVPGDAAPGRETELLLGADDRHLDFRLSVIRPADAPQELRLATLVHRNNALGRLYLAAILPFHVMIVRDALARVPARYATPA
ncbi:DUF2867 domain-containing protein [Albimonas sp. CAU 1670]|uniref:DUF2867 domain-containing protein n=1 Tax=Albimonas sp. CAU 1670 TaxID=3032599 RepID=UPI0023DA405A|nr:DUF2867 domain-containing protein [Albimonas sp. CAU 1670]MDF2231038.1 DUF2867 domain-containing protein [Albimonas sp. CAU 1670]